MSDYTNSFGGASKDSGNDTILGAQHDTEYDGIATMSGTKANKIVSATDGALIKQDSGGDLADASSGTSTVNALTVAGALSCAGFTSTGIDDNADSTALTLDVTTLNATFAGTLSTAGSITLGNSGSAAFVKIDGPATGSPKAQWLQNGTEKASIEYADSGDIFNIDADGQIILKSSNTTALTLDTSQNATFAGTVDVSGTDVTITNATSPAFIATDTGAATVKLQADNTQGILETTSTHGLVIRTDATAAITIDTSQNATFAGTVDVSGTGVTITNATDPQFRAIDSTNSCTAKLLSTDSGALVGTESAHNFAIYSNNTEAVSFDTSQKATFAGDVDISAGTVTFASGAVDQTALGVDSVGQSEVKTDSQAIAGAGEFTATGGIYVMGHSITVAAGTGTLDRSATITGARWLYTESSGSASLSYINSSPPYDLGDGEVPYFVYLKIKNSDSSIVQLSGSPDPIWAYNGPTNTVPDIYNKKTGKNYQIRKDMSGYPDTLAQAKAKGNLKEYLDTFNSASEIEIEVTQAIKNADMDIISSPFDAEAGHTLVMIDPVSPIMGELLTLTQHDNGEVADVIKNYLKFGNTSLNRNGPAGLMVSSVSWKNTA